MIEQFYDLKPQVLELDRKTLELCRDQFAHLEEIRDYNQLKMLRAFTDCGVEARHFLGSGHRSGIILGRAGKSGRRRQRQTGQQ